MYLKIINSLSPLKHVKRKICVKKKKKLNLRSLERIVLKEYNIIIFLYF